VNFGVCGDCLLVAEEFFFWLVGLPIDSLRTDYSAFTDVNFSFYSKFVFRFSIKFSRPMATLFSRLACLLDRILRLVDKGW